MRPTISSTPTVPATVVAVCHGLASVAPSLLLPALARLGCALGHAHLRCSAVRGRARSRYLLLGLLGRDAALGLKLSKLGSFVRDTRRVLWWFVLRGGHSVRSGRP